MRKSAIILAALAVVLAGMGIAWAQDNARVARAHNKPVRSTFKPPAPAITVSRHMTGRVLHIGDMITVTFKVKPELERQPIFQIILLKGRAHTVKASWMGSHRIDPPHTYMTTWRIPSGFATGSDYFVKVVHAPTRKAGFSGLFTISDGPRLSGPFRRRN